MTTEIKPSAVRRFRRRRANDILVYNFNDGLWYFQKIHHDNIVKDWTMDQMETLIAHRNWQEIKRDE